jgi:hypothetical protein
VKTTVRDWCIVSNYFFSPNLVSQIHHLLGLYSRNERLWNGRSSRKADLQLFLLLWLVIIDVADVGETLTCKNLINAAILDGWGDRFGKTAQIA